MESTVLSTKAGALLLQRSGLAVRFKTSELVRLALQHLFG
jgi:hypothetical protein